MVWTYQMCILCLHLFRSFIIMTAVFLWKADQSVHESSFIGWGGFVELRIYCGECSNLFFLPLFCHAMIDYYIIILECSFIILYYIVHMTAFLFNCWLIFLSFSFSFNLMKRIQAKLPFYLRTCWLKWSFSLWKCVKKKKGFVFLEYL